MNSENALEHMRQEQQQMLDSKTFDMFLQITERLGKVETLMISNNNFMQSFERRQDAAELRQSTYELKIEDRFKPLETAVTAVSSRVSTIESKQKIPMTWAAKIAIVVSLITALVGTTVLVKYVETTQNEKIQNQINQNLIQKNKEKIDSITPKSE